MSATSTSRGLVVADRPSVEEDGSPIGEMANITLHTPRGDTRIQYDPSTLEVDHDIGVVCATLQSMRNMGMLGDAVIAMSTADGITNEFRLSEIVLVE